MSLKTVFTSLLLVVCALAPLQAEEIVLFDALEAGINPWVWDGARIAKKSGKFVLTNDNKPNTSDAVFLDLRFPLLDDAFIDVDIKHVRSGNFTFQVLFFQGHTYLASTELIKKTQTKGAFTFPLEDIKDIPEGTDLITFKLWVSPDTPNIELKNIRYYIERPSEDILYSQTYNVTTSFQHENIFPDRNTEELTIKLLSGQPTGTFVINDQIPLLPDAGYLIMQLKQVENGTLTLQGCAFDAHGVYLESVDLSQQAAGSIIVDLKKVTWPAGTKTFQCKLWLGGANAVATLDRLLLIK